MAEKFVRSSAMSANQNPLNLVLGAKQGA